MAHTRHLLRHLSHAAKKHTYEKEGWSLLKRVYSDGDKALKNELKYRLSALEMECRLAVNESGGNEKMSAIKERIARLKRALK